MANYSLDFSGVADSTAANTLTAVDGQTHSGGANFTTINGRMYNTNGGDAWMDISGDFPDTFSFDLDMHYLTSGTGNMGFAFAADAAHTEYMLITSTGGNVILYHRTGGTFYTLHTEPVGVATGNDLSLIHIEVSPTAVSFSYGGTEVHSETRTTNSETYTKCAWRCTLNQASTTSTHVNSIALVDPASARNYVDGPNVLLLPANVDKTYTDGQYDVYASIIDNDATTATDTSTLSVGFGITHDAAMAHGTDFDVVATYPTTTPTTGNTTLTNGTVVLTPDSVTGTDPYTITFPISRLDKQEDSYVWTLDINGETSDTSSLAYTIDGVGANEFYGTVTDQANWIALGYTEVVDGDNIYFVRTSGSGDVFVETASFPAGTIGQVYIQQASDDVWGAPATLTVPAAPSFLPIFARFNNQLIGGM